jgi:ubiquitin-protein ligase
MVSTNKRRDKDVMKLLVSDFDVNLINENNMSEFIVKFVGPAESPYEGVSINKDFKLTALIHLISLLNSINLI